MTVHAHQSIVQYVCTVQLNITIKYYRWRSLKQVYIQITKGLV